MRDFFAHLFDEFQLPLASPVLVFSVILLIILLSPILLRRLNIPGIIGLIISGVIIGPHGLNVLYVLYGPYGLDGGRPERLASRAPFGTALPDAFQRGQVTGSGCASGRVARPGGAVSGFQRHGHSCWRL